jgi:hypothetical protein
MPNQRSENQTLIAFALDIELLRGLDKGRARIDQNRSDFIRDALKKELRRLGIIIPESKIRAPDRTRLQRYPEEKLTDTTLNEDSGANPAVADKLANLMPDPNLPANVKAAADELMPMPDPAAMKKRKRRK